MYWRFTGTVLLIVWLAAAAVPAADRGPVTPQPKDRCPVCGMFPAKYPDTTAQILFKDGSYAVFDGAKDMFRYYFNLEKFTPRRTPADMEAVYVTDYYRLAAIDGFMAYYVAGSSVYGPMGRELIAFEREAEAKEFMVDHAGKSLLRFEDVTAELIEGLQ